MKIDISNLETALKEEVEALPTVNPAKERWLLQSVFACYDSIELKVKWCKLNYQVQLRFYRIEGQEGIRLFIDEDSAVLNTFDNVRPSKFDFLEFERYQLDEFIRDFSATAARLGFNVEHVEEWYLLFRKGVPM